MSPVVLPMQDSRASTRVEAVRAAPDRAAAEAVAHEARLSQCFADLVETGASVQSFVVRHPRSAFGILRDIRALPKLPAVLPAGREAAAVREQMMRHPTSRRFMSGVTAVLRIPELPGTYLDGHDRATVRRKVRAAVKKGVTVRPVPRDERPALLAAADRHEQQNERAEYRVERPQNDDLLEYDLWYAAYDQEDRPVALAVTPTAGDWATLRYFRTLHPGPVASDARYLMTQAIAEALSTQGVRWLVDTARPHWLPNGLRHFQRMVGFRLVRVGAVRVTG